MIPPKRRQTDGEDEARAAASLWKKNAVWATTALIATGGGIGGYRALDTNSMQKNATGSIQSAAFDAAHVQLDRAIADIAELNVKMERVQTAIARIEGNVAYLVREGAGR